MVDGFVIAWDPGVIQLILSLAVEKNHLVLTQVLQIIFYAFLLKLVQVQIE